MNDRERGLLHDVASDTRFELEIERVPAVGVAAVRGLGARARFLSVPEGGVAQPRLFVEDTRWEPLVVERVVCAGSPPLLEWFASGDPRDGAILLLQSDRRRFGRFVFHRGRPARWWGPELDAHGNWVALEALEIVHEGVVWQDA